MKIITIIGLIFITLILSFILPNKIDEYKLSESQEKVVVRVLQLPNCSSGYKNKFIHISYKNKKYVLRTQCKYVKSLVTGQELIMLHKAGTDIFLFQNENATVELVSIIVLAIFLIISFGVLAWKQRKAT